MTVIFLKIVCNIFKLNITQTHITSLEFVFRIQCYALKWLSTMHLQCQGV